MTVAELIEELERLDSDLKVTIEILGLVRTIKDVTEVNECTEVRIVG